MHTPNTDRLDAIKRILGNDTALVLAPSLGAMPPGTRVRTLRDSRHQAHKPSACLRCEGGQWLNPHDREDKRECYSCEGTGIKHGPAVGDADGDPVWVHIPEGTHGVVVSHRTFGRPRYRGGVIEGHRGNTSIRIRLDDGRIVPVSASAIRLDREPITAEEAAARYDAAMARRIG